MGSHTIIRGSSDFGHGLGLSTLLLRGREGRGWLHAFLQHVIRLEAGLESLGLTEPDHPTHIDQGLMVYGGAESVLGCSWLVLEGSGGLVERGGYRLPCLLVPGGSSLHV